MAFFAPGSATLVAAAITLGFIAFAACLSVFKARRETQNIARIARRRAKRMSDLLQTIGMAEKISGLGIWQYDPTSGAQQWSIGMRRLFGVQHDEAFVEGDAETLLYANDVDLIGKVSRRSNLNEPFDLSFDILGADGEPRTIRVEACNLRGNNGDVSRVVAVLRDVTDEKERERELEYSRKAAVQEARRARDLADTDPLTGLANRRRAMAELDRHILSARHSQTSLVLVVFDIDHFKQVNDRHGHPAGDKVLKVVAQIARQQARDHDLVARVGGEEFVWIVPGASSEFARIMTERLRAAIARGSSVGKIPPVTISVGYTDWQAGDTSLTLFARADRALYDAKNSGRNKVCMAA
ncbi:MAG: sensor domain-containing diguanylate cyclase [Pseudomonadota bacterium]